MLARYGGDQLTVHAPCWWHRINHLERMLSQERCRNEFPDARVQQAIAIMGDKGYERVQIERFLRAANGNIPLAFRYLRKTGIPRGVVVPPDPVLPPDCVGEVFIRRPNRGNPPQFMFSSNHATELVRTMTYFAQQYVEYQGLTGHALREVPDGVILSQIISQSLQRKSALRIDQFRIPSLFDTLEYPHTRLTFCEYAAILFFSRDEMQPGAYSTYTMLNSTMNFIVTGRLTSADYVRRIRHPFIMLFYSALYKCPRVRDILRIGEISPGMRYLHRFMVVNQRTYDLYKDQPLGLISFYCFQSFSFRLARDNIFPFTNPTGDKDCIILLRVEINANTSARLMSHYSDLETENEAIALPCVPYQILEKQEFNDQQQFKTEIFNGSGFNYTDNFHPGIREYLIVTVSEQRYGVAMQGRSNPLFGGK